MPMMYHENATEPVNVSPGNVDTMKNRGWYLKEGEGAVDDDREQPDASSAEEE